MKDSVTEVRAVMDGNVLHLGAQTCHWEQEGPYTGEVSPHMLQGLVSHVLVGHSERRAAGETDEQVARKVAAAGEAGLIPLLFVGEEPRGADYLGETEDRLRRGLSAVEVASQAAVVVYEPAWAIDAANAAPIAHVRHAVAHVKAVMRQLGSDEPVVLYGGSVTDDNVDELAGLDVLDGLGATRTSLDAARFLRLVERMAAARLDGHA
jgi:triosephosphate isomerase (TIM)